MNKKVLTAAASIALMFAAQTAYASEEGGRGQGGDRKGPPPEAFTACEGKSVGDTSSFEGRNGETLSGTCEETPDGQMVLHPDNAPQRQ